jgi:hypothetical protein
MQGKMARTQNRPNVSQGASLDAIGPGSAGSPGLTDADRDFIREIHQAKNLDGTPLRLDELLFMRAENIRMQQQAMQEFGPKAILRSAHRSFRKSRSFPWWECGCDDYKGMVRGDSCRHVVFHSIK